MPLFKYFSKESHAAALMNRGELRFNTLAHFRAHEDLGVRGDPDDGRLVFQHGDGINVRKADGSTVFMPGGRFVADPNIRDIFVYCASTVLSNNLARRFNSPFCVEIFEPEELLTRLRQRAHQTSKLDYEQLEQGAVRYRYSDELPGTTWAQPNQLAFIKPPDFSWQQEYRIAVGRRGAFDLEAGTYSLQTGPEPPSEAASSDPAITLRIGTLHPRCRLHRFPD